eukprot:CAMPEP_0197910426 /NCGR_PEP_ID=MMETSP1439-20131203/70892_1 /TAXON_ID=66791 /ORGANISM="Gonyaulax spinifera, Strain CCMP409" /LENGTH=107 /DNA_ID=CAMNT_0043532083 /DNA_START=31 /DNA_END=351 /DNA_ORIENTATION=-
MYVAALFGPTAPAPPVPAPPSCPGRAWPQQYLPRLTCPTLETVNPAPARGARPETSFNATARISSSQLRSLASGCGVARASRGGMLQLRVPPPPRCFNLWTAACRPS